MNHPSQTLSLNEFRDAVSGLDEDIDLARAAILVARVEYPELEIEPFLDSLDALAAQVISRTGRHPDPLARVTALLEVVIKEQGLKGAQEHYYDPRNSFLNDVLDRQVGIPITLSIIVMSVGSRCGIALGGTSMPMHFLVRVLGVEPPVFIDCYHGGRLLKEPECRELLRIMSQGTLPFRREMLNLVSNCDVLTRFLTNLKLIYLNASLYTKAVPVLDRLLILNPNSPILLRERGLVHYHLGQSELARQDLQSYLSVSPEAADAQEILNLLWRLE